MGSPRISLVFALSVRLIMVIASDSLVLRFVTGSFRLQRDRLFRDSCLQLECCPVSSAAAACSFQALQG